MTWTTLTTEPTCAAAAAPECGGGLDGGDITTEEHGDITAADLFPAGDVDVRGFERGIGGLNGGAETFAFNHSNSLF